MINRMFCLSVLTAIATCAALLPASAWSQARAPLLIEGKTTLFQRVLTRPGATLAPAAGAAPGKPVPTFSAYYVYGHGKAGGQDWLQIGGSTDGKSLAWLKASDSVPWQHTIIAAFANPTDRQSVLFFRQRDGLMSALAADPPALDRNSRLPTRRACG